MNEQVCFVAVKRRETHDARERRTRAVCATHKCCNSCSCGREPGLDGPGLGPTKNETSLRGLLFRSIVATRTKHSALYDGIVQPIELEPSTPMAPGWLPPSLSRSLVCVEV